MFHDTFGLPVALNEFAVLGHALLRSLNHGRGVGRRG
jgi:hypothetical protein